MHGTAPTRQGCPASQEHTTTLVGVGCSMPPQLRVSPAWHRRETTICCLNPAASRAAAPQRPAATEGTNTAGKLEAARTGAWACTGALQTRRRCCLRSPPSLPQALVKGAASRVGLMRDRACSITPRCRSPRWAPRKGRGRAGGRGIGTRLVTPGRGPCLHAHLGHRRPSGSPARFRSTVRLSKE